MTTQSPQLDRISVVSYTDPMSGLHYRSLAIDGESIGLSASKGWLRSLPGFILDGLADHFRRERLAREAEKPKSLEAAKL